MAKSSNPDGEPRKPRRLLMMAVLGLVAVAGYKFVFAPAPAAESKTDKTVIEEGAVAPLPELVLNLADKEPRYLRVGIALILEKGTPTEAVKEELPIASDVAVDVLSAKTFAELHQPGAKQEIKEELSAKVRKAFHDEKVARVIFTSFVMQ